MEIAEVDVNAQDDERRLDITRPRRSGSARVKRDEEFSRGRPARDCWHHGSRGVLHAAVPPLEPKKALFAVTSTPDVRKKNVSNWQKNSVDTEKAKM